MKYYYVYFVRCSDNSLYIGITNNTEKRISEHNYGVDPKSYTYSCRPVGLVYLEEFTDPNQAIVREKQLKGWSRAKKAALIKKNEQELILRSKRRKKRDRSL